MRSAVQADASRTRLRPVCLASYSAPSARLIQRASEIEESWLDGVGTLGLTAGASAPESLVREVVDVLRQWRTVEEHTLKTAEEHMIFKLPRQLTE